MTAIEDAHQQGLSYEQAAEKLGMSPRRLERWKQEKASGVAPAARIIRPYNAMTEEEKVAVKEMVADEKHADESARGLSVRLMEEKSIYVSHVSIWEYERSIGVNGPRGHRRNQGRRGPEKPDTSFVTGPHQLWSWDITKLRTPMAYVFFYLIAILDVFSRKVVGWLVTEHETSEAAKRAWDIALVNEGLTQAGPEEMPKSLSDRGSQMRSISTALFFKKLGIDRLFARPRTPNDNPQVESLFSTVKTAPAYPGIFEGAAKAVVYFDIFFPWYNDEHLHTALEMMTPSDWHSGRYVQIREERRRIKEETFAKRRALNLGLCSIKNNTKNATLLD
jgi:transposase InsO family protein